MKVKIFKPILGNYQTREEGINKWLSENRHVEIIDIKYAYCAYDGGWYSAMVIYKEKEI